MKFLQKGQCALVTGASSGIGAAFARELGKLGLDLVLVARREDPMREMADSLHRSYGIQSKVISWDLSHPQGITDLVKKIGQVNVLINNAGFGDHGALVEMDLANQLRMIHLNVNVLVTLTGHFLPQMIQRGYGAILNVASTAAFQPWPYHAVYGATKAFVLSFTEAIAEETRKSGVRVMAVCPGPTRTEFGRIAKSEQLPAVKIIPYQSADAVVQYALRDLESNKRVSIPGLSNKVGVFLSQISPRIFVSRILGYISRPS